MDREKILDLVLSATHNINNERNLEEQFEVTENTLLFGAGAQLDSLSLVSLIVDVESMVSELIGRDVSLTDDRAMSQVVSPFTSIATLTDYICLLLQEGE